MTNEEFQKHLTAVIEAIESGSLEEHTVYDGSEDWRPVKASDLVLHLGLQYRVKREPRECWVDSTEEVHWTPISPGTHFREVLE